MSVPPVIDVSWHPLVTGCPPAWASEWGQDQHGIFIAFTLGEVTQRLRWIPPGRFLMGSPAEEAQILAKGDDERAWFEREQPRHPVFITQGFWLFDTPCTQELWETVMDANPSRFQDPQRPVEQVSWEDVQEFMHRINGRIPGLDLRLPSEAQWEHACRAGTDTALYTGPIEFLGANNAPALDLIAWYGGNSGLEFDLEDGEDSTGWSEKQFPHWQAGSRKVKFKQPNPWGLYDMLGNVWEWCADGPRGYGEDATIDPVGPQDADAGRVVRGGSWSSSARDCRSACRGRYLPGNRLNDLGFRCARAQDAWA